MCTACLGNLTHTQSWQRQRTAPTVVPPLPRRGQGARRRKQEDLAPERLDRAGGAGQQQHRVVPRTDPAVGRVHPAQRSDSDLGASTAWRQR